MIGLGGAVEVYAGVKTEHHFGCKKYSLGVVVQTSSRSKKTLEKILCDKFTLYNTVFKTIYYAKNFEEKIRETINAKKPPPK